VQIITIAQYIVKVKRKNKNLSDFNCPIKYRKNPKLRKYNFEKSFSGGYI